MLKLTISKIILPFLLLIFSFALHAKNQEQYELAQAATKALYASDNASFYEPVINDTLANIDELAKGSLGLTKKESNVIREKLKVELKGFLFNIMVQSRMALYSKTELKAMVNQYTSPLGKNIAQKLPLINLMSQLEPQGFDMETILSEAEIKYAVKFALSPEGEAIAKKDEKLRNVLARTVREKYNELVNIISETTQKYLMDRK